VNPEGKIYAGDQLNIGRNTRRLQCEKYESVWWKAAPTFWSWFGMVFWPFLKSQLIDIYGNDMTEPEVFEPLTISSWVNDFWKGPFSRPSLFRLKKFWGGFGAGILSYFIKLTCLIYWYNNGAAGGIWTRAPGRLKRFSGCGGKGRTFSFKAKNTDYMAEGVGFEPTDLPVCGFQVL